MATTSNQPDAHVCQPFVGIRGDDPGFPLKYQRDPWCWAPELGFHRASRPRLSVRLRVAPGSRFVGPDFINVYQALCLGSGLGTSNIGDAPAEFVHRFCELHTRTTFTDAGPFAQFAHACRGYDDLQPDQQTAFHRAVFHQAYRLMSPLPADVLGPWKRLFDRLLADKPLAAKDEQWAAECASSAYRRAAKNPGRRRGRWYLDPDDERDVACGRVLDALSNARHGGNSRGLARLFSLAEPTEQQAARWLDDLGSYIGRHLAAHETASGDRQGGVA
ncbi:hypothetical protein [Nonomuraea sp. NPDC050643]|uniref:hypothetical protein n=1 Tax=Nonomuraea sp. NPDC050643 TaxID=3155660 RepID=UPI00340D2AC6